MNFASVLMMVEYLLSKGFNLDTLEKMSPDEFLDSYLDWKAEEPV